MSVATAFLRRDALTAISYRLSFLMQVVGVLFSMAAFYFVAKLFGSAMVPQLEQYGGDYFSFVLIGLAFSNYLGLSLSNYASSIREGQMTGTLEIMLLSPTKLSAILLSSSIWAYLLTTVNVILYLLLGVLIFGFDISHSNVLTAVVVLILSVANFSSIGILSAAMVLVVKKGDPVSWVFGGASSLLAGVYYPISVLPDWLTPISRALPLTYALDGMRLAMLRGYSLYQIRFDVLVLLGFSVVLIPVSLLVFKAALKRAKAEGSLIQY